MKSKKISYPLINIGTSFMLVIFIILCMVIFAVLSFSNALKDYNYSKNNATLTLEHYTANNLAEEKLAQIDEGITNGTITEPIVTYTIPVNDSKVLEVVLEVHPDSETNYTIISWKEIVTSSWNADQTLSVFGSE